MKALQWKKHGLIFNPAEHQLPDGCVSFAQSPQTLVFDDFVRVYFSSRQVDHNGKFLSRICYADMDSGFQRVLRISPQEVLPLGKPGCFDEHGIFPFHVHRSSRGLRGYISGWTRRVSVSVDTGIGISESHDDGKTFQRLGNGPIVGASLHEPFLVGDPFVLERPDAFHMWYIFGTRWTQFTDGAAPDRVYKIGHATSSDGITWHKDHEGRKIIADQLNESESQALPTVIEIDGRFHMFFCFREAHGFRQGGARGYRIGHAWSDDLVDWHRNDEAGGLTVGAPGEWDSEMMCYPHVFHCNDRILMLYNGNAFGRHGFGLAELTR